MNTLKNIKAFYFDLDGTLFIDSKLKKIDISSIEAINYLKQKGFKVGIATGRHHIEITKVIEQINPTLPTISVNGTIINDSLRNESENISYFSKSETIKIISFLNSQNLNFVLYGFDFMYYKVADISNDKIKSYYEMKQKNAFDEKVKAYFFFDENIEKTSRANKFLIFSKEVSKSKMQELHKYLIKSEVSASVLQGFSSVIEIFPKQTSKGFTLKKIMQDKNLKKENIIFFGDGLNDIEICKEAGVCVVMNNAENDLKEHATFITKSNLENGVSSFIKDNF
ncbi:Cof-type HAD-IIB family hydrolase [[Mycoplasma] mobile]|uniref:COF family HAD hydrolase protein n=1 Tax=Mycoplasma mobile (strain ATCC 43663 / 163K / NCTC 11711) TaxID=267748 RepID=Q6KIP3_MYCM1|nr:Cof-type HAD-IIB family hydrolase [[Mycoplasma] mobile]AAT27533.1 COF family HAD hydrolase protein [Mycoplasma mobile 163K]